jgi:hypothetical protein
MDNMPPIFEYVYIKKCGLYVKQNLLTGAWIAKSKGSILPIFFLRTGTSKGVRNERRLSTGRSVND